MPKVAAAVDSLFAEVRASIENAHALGMYDPVTSLPNRLHFRSEADKLMSEVLEGERSAMLFVDLDRFKLVNDSLGHARGDQLLIMVANRLRVVVNAEFTGSVRTRPLLARLAGDEFTIFFPEIQSVAEIERVARRIVVAISEPFELCSHSVDIGASIGIAISPEHGPSIESLMRAADIAMYRAKASGGGQYCLFDSELAAEHQQKIETEKALTEAVLRDEFVLAFQPQMSLVTGEIAGAEALLRWNHPRDGLRLPGTFIPVAERTGLVADIGDWVIGEVAPILGALASAGLQWPARIQHQPATGRPPRLLREAPPSVRRCRGVAVADRARIHRKRGNGSGRVGARGDRRPPQRWCADRYRRFRDWLLEPGPPSRNAARPGQTRPVADADIEVSDKARVIVQAVIQLIKGVECEIVAEAVETSAQADMLRAMGCDTIQGYVFAPPMMEDEFLEWTSKGKGADVKSVA